MSKSYSKQLQYPVAFILVLFLISFVFKGEEEKIDYKKVYRDKIEKFIVKNNSLPSELIQKDVPDATVEYYLNKKFNTYLEKLLKRYQSDYSAIVVIDNETGKIIGMTGREKKTSKMLPVLPLTTTHPAASIFKIVTTAALISKNKINVDDYFYYNGRGTTLYKYQLKDKKNKWTRKVNFKTAFASSNNVVFAKAAINNISTLPLTQMAHNFGFNQKILTEINMTKPYYQIPVNNYNMAEIASGMNKITMTGPLHVAVMGSIIANNGIYKSPKLIKNILVKSSGESVKLGDSIVRRAISEETALNIKELMQLTVKKGTARKEFRRFKLLRHKKITIGAKTGSLTGGLPYGKRDWFLAYAIPTSRQFGNGISICVMNINIKKWYHKSSFIAKKAIQYYFTKINSVLKNKSVLTLNNSYLRAKND